jgi:hypothetical protein
VLVHPDEDIGQVRGGVDVVRLAGGDQRVEARDVLARLVTADEEEVLPAEGHASQCRLGRVVVQGRFSAARARPTGSAVQILFDALPTNGWVLLLPERERSVGDEG